jgi:hypothetical protein
MANLLNFNATRDLGFSHMRELQVDLNRALNFDLNRELVFNPDRDLGFGKRGVLFRGYVCENCGAIVSVDATSCDECGAVFEEPKVVGVMKAPPVMTPEFGRESAPTPPTAVAEPRVPPAPRGYPPPPTPREIPPTKAAAPLPPAAPPATGTASLFCPNCGARSWQGDAFCWNCGARFTESAKGAATSPTGSSVPMPASAEKVQLPPKKARKVVKDWQETGKTWEEYSEEK